MKGLADLAKSAGVVFVGTVFGQLLGLIGELTIARSVVPSTLGRLGLAYALVSTLGTIALFGVPAGVTRLLSADDSERSSGILPAGYLISVLSSGALALVLFLFRHRIDALAGDARIGGVLPLFLPYLLVLPIARISFSALRAGQRTLPATLSKQIGPRAVALPTLAVLVFVFREPKWGAVAYWLLIPALTGLLSLWFLRRTDFSTVSRPTRYEIGELWRFSWPLAISVSLTILLTRLDILMLGLYVDASWIGQYRAIQPLRQITSFVSGAFGFLFLPLATTYYESGELDELDRLYRTSTKWIVSLALPFVLVFTLFSDDVIRVFLGEQYLPASTALSILIGGLFFRSLVGLDTDLLKAVDRTRVELGCSLVGVFANVLLNLALIPRLGIAGAAVATVVGFFVYNLCEIAVIYRLVGTHPFGANNLKPLFPTVAVGIAVQSALAGATLGLPSLLLVGIVFSVTHLASLVVTRSLSEYDAVIVDELESRLGFELSTLRSLVD